VLKRFVDKNFKTWQPGAWEDVTGPKEYKPFSELVHTTHVEVAKTVLPNGGISPQAVNDYTQLSGVLPAVWLAPGPNGNDVYGPVTIHIDTRVLIGKRCFFVECIDYKRSEMATRFVFVDTGEHGDSQLSALRAAGVKLSPYNPFNDEGPWKVDDEGKMVTLTSGLSFEGGPRNHTTEFVVLDDVPLTARTLTNITTNAHNGWCKKKENTCPEGEIELSDVLHALPTMSLVTDFGFDVLRFVAREVKSRFREDSTEIVDAARRGKFKGLISSCPEIRAALGLGELHEPGHNDECVAEHFPAGIDFPDYRGNEFCKAVCEAVNGTYNRGDAVTNALVEAVANGKTSLTPEQWMAVLASFLDSGPVRVQYGNQLKVKNQVRLIDVAAVEIAALPPPFLSWWVSHNSVIFE
jgi:hypothetical protein